MGFQQAFVIVDSASTSGQHITYEQPDLPVPALRELSIISPFHSANLFQAMTLRPFPNMVHNKKGE